MSKPNTKTKAKPTDAASAPAKAVPGIWTPFAQVQCLTCHGEKLIGRPGSPREYGTRDVARAPDQYEGIGVCDDCRTPVCVRKDVAALQALGFALSALAWEAPFSWGLRQTGGGCAGIGVFRGEGTTDAETKEIIDEVIAAGHGGFLSAAHLDVTKPWDDRECAPLAVSPEIPLDDPERMARWILRKLRIPLPSSTLIVVDTERTKRGMRNVYETKDRQFRVSWADRQGARSGWVVLDKVAERSLRCDRLDEVGETIDQMRKDRRP